MSSLHSIVIDINVFFSIQELVDLKKLVYQTFFLLQHSGWLPKISTNLIMNDGRLHSVWSNLSGKQTDAIRCRRSSFQFVHSIFLKPRVKTNDNVILHPHFCSQYTVAQHFRQSGCVFGICYHHQEVLNYTETIVYNQVICATFLNYTSKNMDDSNQFTRGLCLNSLLLKGTRLANCQRQDRLS
jgi:hypothetical protein